MIGNDIVDFQYARRESNWRRPRFLDKIFTAQEQNFIRRSTNPEKKVWVLWSMKESAYKIAARLGKKRFLAPKQFECFNLSLIGREGNRGEAAQTEMWKKNESKLVSGEVAFENHVFFTQSKLSDHYVHTIAQSEIDSCRLYDSEDFFIAKTNYQNQSQSVRRKLLARYASLTMSPPSALNIQKNKLGVPYLYDKKGKQVAIISISHHGNYGGFVIIKF